MDSGWLSGEAVWEEAAPTGFVTPGRSGTAATLGDAFIGAQVQKNWHHSGPGKTVY
jgi:hypothetical protein